jgi:Na+-driven multidrug efflux pump
MQYAKQYLAIAVWGLVPYTLAQVYASTLRETGLTLPPMIAGVLGVGANLVLNLLLIYGNLGFPRLGVAGAAIATVISRFVECAIVIIWTHSHTEKCEFIKGAYRSPYIPAPLMKRIAITGIPLMLNETVWAAGQAMLLQCYSVRGIAVVSAMNITNTVNNTFSVLFMAVGSAVAILLGHQLGAGRTDEARADAKKMIVFSVFMGLLSGILVAIAAPIFPQISIIMGKRSTSSPTTNPTRPGMTSTLQRPRRPVTRSTTRHSAV